tara:strand:+ start:371 stop:709 length:339 start_codon:yes stop_codon:yes gene_type:complete
MNKFIYIGDIAASSAAYMYPAESFRGAHPKADDTLNVYFTPSREAGLAPDKDNDVWTLSLSSNNKHKEVMVAIAEAIAHGDEQIIVLADTDDSIFISEHVNGVSLQALSSDV